MAPRTKYLTADQILAADDRPVTVLDVPEWGGAVRLRPLSLAEYWEVENRAQIAGRAAPQEKSLAMLQKSVVDADGEPMFDDESIKALGRKSFKAAERVFVKIIEISDLTGELVEEMGATFLEGES